MRTLIHLVSVLCAISLMVGALVCTLGIGIEHANAQAIAHATADAHTPTHHAHAPSNNDCPTCPIRHASIDNTVIVTKAPISVIETIAVSSANVRHSPVSLPYAARSHASSTLSIVSDGCLRWHHTIVRLD